jgi:uncharacterized membrane-anchored protein
MTGRRRIAFALVVGVQALSLLALIGMNEIALATGDKVTLRTVPVDPVDLFRGNYVVLRYEISTVNVLEGTQPDDVVYVPLHEEDGRWTGGFGYPTPPSDGEFIRGTVRSAQGASANLEYGIETYYADHEEAYGLQSAGSLDVTVALGDDGRAHISRVERVR